jgi:hypothetical protein
MEWSSKGNGMEFEQVVQDKFQFHMQHLMQSWGNGIWSLQYFARAIFTAQEYMIINAVKVGFVHLKTELIKRTESTAVLQCCSPCSNLGSFANFQ